MVQDFWTISSIEPSSLQDSQPPAEQAFLLLAGDLFSFHSAISEQWMAVNKTLVVSVMQGIIPPLSFRIFFQHVKPLFGIPLQRRCDIFFKFPQCEKDSQLSSTVRPQKCTLRRRRDSRTHIANVWSGRAIWHKLAMNFSMGVWHKIVDTKIVWKTKHVRHCHPFATLIFWACLVLMIFMFQALAQEEAEHVQSWSL